MEEIWAKIDLNTKYEYFVSNLGNTKRRAYDRRRRTGEYIDVPQFTDKKGYKHISIAINGVYKQKSVHRLVATYFIPNDSNKPEVNHLNYIKGDNRVSNLEWCTRQENMVHSLLNEKNLESTKVNGRKGIRVAHEVNKSIFLDTRNGVYLISIKELSQYLGTHYDVARDRYRKNRLGDIIRVR